jgi:hypothetical protein
MPEDRDIIAERVFYIDGKKDVGPAVIFRLWRPYQPGTEYARCRFELVTSKGSQEQEVPGVDAVDCIIASLSMAGSTLAGLNESVFEGRLRWEASPEGGRGLGLPTIEDSCP